MDRVPGATPYSFRDYVRKAPSILGRQNGGREFFYGNHIIQGPFVSMGARERSQSGESQDMAKNIKPVSAAPMSGPTAAVPKDPQPSVDRIDELARRIRNSLVPPPDGTVSLATSTVR
jgi:hypothetical protein